MDLTAHWVGFAAIAIFVVAYSLVIVEEFTHLRKSVPVMFAAGAIWAIIAAQYAMGGLDHEAHEAVKHFLIEFGELFLFLLCAMTYVNSMRHVLAMQRKARRDHDYIAPTLGQLGAVVADGLPESVDDMRAYFADRIETVRQRMQGSNTDMWQAYWSDERPNDEIYCRNRLVEHVSGQLPPSIRFEPERYMAGQKRADIAVIRNTIMLPVEIKGQWNREVWDAACEQLDANYTRDWQAEGRGVYIVLWFGDVAGKNLPAHPEGLPPPKTPGELKNILEDRIPEARRSDLDVFVIDVSGPKTRC